MAKNIFSTLGEISVILTPLYLMRRQSLALCLYEKPQTKLGTNTLTITKILSSIPDQCVACHSTSHLPETNEIKSKLTHLIQPQSQKVSIKSNWEFEIDLILIFKHNLDKINLELNLNNLLFSLQKKDFTFFLEITHFYASRPTNVVGRESKKIQIRPDSLQ